MKKQNSIYFMVNLLILYLSQSVKFYSQCTKASDLSFSVENKIKVVINISMD
jgi:hypothetical protein